MDNTKRADSLQFLRFCAFLLVFIRHAGTYFPAWFPSRNAGVSAVEFFIVLSGFVYGYSAYGTEANLSVKEILNYIWKKLKKLYPLYIVTTLLAISYSSLPALLANHQFSDAIPPIKQLFKCVLLIQAWFPEGYFSYNGLGWFLSTVMFLYFLNLPMKYIFTKMKKTWCLLVLVVLMFVAEYFYCYLTRDTNVEWTQYILPVSRIAEYICGMALGYYIRTVDVDNNAGSKSNIKWKVVFSLMELGVIAIWICNLYLPMADWQFRTFHWMLPNCLLICTFGIGKGIISDIFKWDFLRYLGDISFECFLLHQMFIHVYDSLSGVRDISRLGNYFSFLFCLVGTVAIAALISKRKIRKKYTTDIKERNK